MVSRISFIVSEDYQGGFDDVGDVQIIANNTSHDTSYSITIEWFPSK